MRSTDVHHPSVFAPISLRSTPTLFGTKSWINNVSELLIREPCFLVTHVLVIECWQVVDGEVASRMKQPHLYPRHVGCVDTFPGRGMPTTCPTWLPIILMSSLISG